MILTNPRTSKTPWDAPSRSEIIRCTPPLCMECDAPVEESPRCVIQLQGIWGVDPTTCSSEDTRLFFWAGLRLLNATARQLGIKDDAVNRIMSASFDAFHDAADDLWGKLQQITAQEWGDIPLAWVEARCRIPAPDASQKGERKLVGMPRSISSPPIADAPELTHTETCDKPVQRIDAAPPSVESTATHTYEESSDYPVADFYQPPDYGWTPQGRKVRAALKRFSESTNADY
ncbi:MAG: hypothetical protein U0800_07870 [Isosphaeraceae bacterium]